MSPKSNSLAVEFEVKKILQIYPAERCPKNLINKIEKLLIKYPDGIFDLESSRGEVPETYTQLLEAISIAIQELHARQDFDTLDKAVLLHDDFWNRVVTKDSRIKYKNSINP
jgi:hypothetical protein